MHWGLDFIELPVELEENILRQFLGARPVTEETQRQTEDKRLVLKDRPGEVNSHTGYYASGAGEIARG
jgi:hypothetical protein